MRQIILFDGVCNLCDSAVQFLIRNDFKKSLMFASLQSESGKALLNEFSLLSDLSTLVYIKGDKAYIKSAAVLEVVSDLKGIWVIFKILKLIPKPVRDLVYDKVARARYKWFGKKEQCMIPTPELKKRFLD
ncbi:MAG: thiol-disulfide oxidoreductase DCC family protein [Bacteroidia bacterium]|nr:thiol-disulfide oxidoreductase DCC family protein [Bacteroidia bacterium]